MPSTTDTLGLEAILQLDDALGVVATLLQRPRNASTREASAWRGIEEAEAVGSRVLFLHRGRARRLLREEELYPGAERGYEITMSLDGLSGMTAQAAQQEITETVQSLFPDRTLGVTTLQVLLAKHLQRD
ncbi:hypothetical protein MRX96_031293 [Rhipicephalus microplus]